MLVYFGAIPFMFGAACLMVGVTDLPIIGPTDTMIAIYGLVIATFLSGIHWGQHLGREDKWRSILPITSNINAVLLWISYLLLPPQLFFCVLMISFLTSLLIDYFLYKHDILSKSYWHHRIIVTFIVCISIFAAAALL